MWDGGPFGVGLSACFLAWAPYNNEVQFCLLVRIILIHPKSTDNVGGIGGGLSPRLVYLLRELLL